MHEFYAMLLHYVTKAGEQKRLASKTTISIDNHQQQNKYQNSAHNVMSISYLLPVRKLHVFLDEDEVIIIRFRFSNSEQ